MKGNDSSISGARELERSGGRLLERMVDYLETLEGRPVSSPRSPAELAERFRDPLPRSGRPADEVWDDVWDRVVPDAIHLAHPMYMGHQVAPPLPHAALADALASLLNQSLAVTEMAPTGTPVEQQIIRWMRELAGYPDDADGTLVSGGSVANLTALLAAREATFPGAWDDGAPGSSRDGGGTPGQPPAAVFAAESAHYSVERTLGVLGLGARALVLVPERRFRMDVAALAESVRAARRDGRVPMAIVATAGSTATGVFDDLDAIADVAAEEGVWLHVDGAHGASFLASEQLRERVRGIERADSIAWDPHKMMFMPISASAILVRDRMRLDAAFQQSAPYLFHRRPDETRSRDLGQRTLQCSRRFDALKLWVAFQHYGLDHFGRLQEQTVENARTLHRLLQGSPDFETIHPPESNILCFRWVPGAATADAGDIDRLQTALRERYNASGRGWITATVLGGRRVLRVTLMNPRTHEHHLRALVDELREQGTALL